MNFKEELALKRKQLAEAEQQKEVIKPIVVKEEMPIKPNEVIKLIKFPKKSKLAIPNEELIEEPVKEGKYNATSDQLYLAYIICYLDIPLEERKSILKPKSNAKSIFFKIIIIFLKNF